MVTHRKHAAFTLRRPTGWCWGEFQNHTEIKNASCQQNVFA